MKRNVEMADILLIIGVVAIVFVILRILSWIILGLLQIDIVTVLIILTVGIALVILAEFLIDRRNKNEKALKKNAPKPIQMQETDVKENEPVTDEEVKTTDSEIEATVDENKDNSVDLSADILETISDDDSSDDLPHEEDEPRGKETMSEYDPERAKMLLMLSDWSDWDKYPDDPIKAKTSCIKLKKYIEERLSDKEHFVYGQSQSLKVSNIKNVTRCLDRIYNPDSKSENNLNGAMYELYEITRNKNNRNMPVTEKEMQLLLVLCVNIIGFIDARYPVAVNIK